ncbi:hypothetical protein DL93DRAFT_2054570 [Clavulina sp. PMI_390]|nr:hypothetical protein DL93DRAFT_2054570 [Clavulina sp. PMI_390]
MTDWNSDVPPQGRRFQTRTTAEFPGVDIVGPPPFTDYGGEPIYVGSAIMEDPPSVHPCKLAPHLENVCMVSYGGQELGHQGRYDLLPIDNHLMEWVATSHGNVPTNRRPVDGGYEAGGERLYHAVVEISGVRVPGKTAPHLGAANVPWGGEEKIVREGYWIL